MSTDYSLSHDNDSRLSELESKIEYLEKAVYDIEILIFNIGNGIEVAGESGNRDNETIELPFTYD